MSIGANCVGYRLTYYRCSFYIIPFRYYDFFVTPDRFELPFSGPKPLVLPLDERVIFADVNGFEPLSKVLETFILPLNYTPVSGERGIRTPVSVT